MDRSSPRPHALLNRGAHGRAVAPQNQGKLNQAGRNIASTIPVSARERSTAGRAASPSQASRRSNSSEASRPPRPARPGLPTLPEAAQNGPASPGARRESSELLGLAKGGEALMKRLADVNSVNGELRRKLEMQSNEISLLESSSRTQQQRLKEFEQRANKARQKFAAAAEAKAKAAAAEREERLQQEVSELQQERDGLLQQLQQCEGERDEARVQLANLANLPEIRQSQAMQYGAFNELPKLPQGIFQAPSTGESAGSRQALAMEMEMRQEAEKKAADAQQEQREMRALLDWQGAEIESLRRQLAQCAEQGAEIESLRRQLALSAEQVDFNQECCQDLQLRLRQQHNKAEERLRKERGRFATVNRLEGVLPKQMLLKALA